MGLDPTRAAGAYLKRMWASVNKVPHEEIVNVCNISRRCQGHSIGGEEPDQVLVLAMQVAKDLDGLFQFNDGALLCSTRAQAQGEN